MTILLACDRTKGHFYPALTLARYIRDKQPPCRVIFYGVKKEDKATLVQEGFLSRGVDLGFRNLVFEGVFRFFESIVLLVLLKPNRVLGFGGRNSFFMLLVSALCFIPTALFEPNASFGRANKVLSFIVGRVFVGLKKVQHKKEVSVGTPLRDELIRDKKDKKAACAMLGMDASVRTILVFGGSTGAVFINNLVSETVKRLHKDGLRFGIIHITGKSSYEQIRSFYQNLKIKASVFDFYQNIGLLYSAADFVVSRSGASTVAEISCFGKAALLIPYPYAYGHQKKNAEVLFNEGSCLMQQQAELNSHKLYSVLKNVMENFEEVSSLGVRAKKQKLWITTENFSKKVLEYFC